MEEDLDDLHLVEGDVSDSVGGVQGRYRHLSPGGGVGQGDVVGTVRHKHSSVRDILWWSRFFVLLNVYRMNMENSSRC